MNDNNKEEEQQNENLEQQNTKRGETIAEKGEKKVEEEDQDAVYERVKQSRFKQQRLPAWRPVPTITSIIIIFAVFGLVFIALGIIVLIYSKKVKSVETEYTDCKLKDDVDSEDCIKTITMSEDIEKPVFIYYQLDGFFQNSRRYVKSKQIEQLTGDDLNAHDDCEPAETNKEMGFGEGKKSIDINSDKTLGLDDIAIPCGLMAKTLFDDDFKFKINGETDDKNIDETNIAFDKDKELFNKNPKPDSQWTDITNEHFLVWMRPSGLPNPRKLWGKINRDLKKDDKIEITIANNYNVSSYEGKKKIILSNANGLGGKNTFLGISYIVVGGLSLICAIIFPIGYKIQSSKEKNE